MKSSLCTASVRQSIYLLVHHHTRHFSHFYVCHAVGSRFPRIFVVVVVAVAFIVIATLDNGKGGKIQPQRDFRDSMCHRTGPMFQAWP